jgi:hypothetical protein
LLGALKEGGTGVTGAQAAAASSKAPKNTARGRLKLGKARQSLTFPMGMISFLIFCPTRRGPHCGLPGGCRAGPDCGRFR